MKLIGYWMADLRDDRDLPLPQELIGSWPADLRAAVCAYLAKGEVFEVYRGLTSCRLGCRMEYHEMWCREFTDGEWVWPEGLLHYVERHDVILPEEFVRDATSGKTPLAAVSNDGVSLECWVEWSRNHRSATIRKQIDVARAAADAASGEMFSRLMDEAIAGVLLKEAEGSEKCVYAACERRALVGRAICARHLVGDDLVRSKVDVLYRLPVLR